MTETKFVMLVSGSPAAMMAFISYVKEINSQGHQLKILDDQSEQGWATFEGVSVTDRATFQRELMEDTQKMNAKGVPLEYTLMEWGGTSQVC